MNNEKRLAEIDAAIKSVFPIDDVTNERIITVDNIKRLRHLVEERDVVEARIDRGEK